MENTKSQKLIRSEIHLTQRLKMINSLLIYFLVPELKKELEGNKVLELKVFPDKKGLLIFARKQDRTSVLFLSIAPESSHIELLTPQETDTIQTQNSSIFSQLTSTILEKIEQADFDRVINFFFVRKNQFEKNKKYRLIAELTGRNANLILVEDETDKILDSLRTIRPRPNALGQIEAQDKYIALPPPKKLNPLIVDPNEFRELLVKNNQESLLGFLTGQFNSIDLLLARQITDKLNMDLHKKVEDLILEETEHFCESFISFFKNFDQLKSNPEIIFNQQGTPETISLFPSPFIPENQKRNYSTINDAIKAFFKMKQKKEDENNLYRIIAKRIAKFSVLEEKLQKDLDNARKYESFKKMGDLLIANAHHLKRGAEQVKLIDVFDDKQKEITIPLDSSLGPRENAKNYFQKSRKGKTAVKIIEDRLYVIKQGKSKLVSLQNQLETHSSSEQLDQIKTELASLGYIKRTRQKPAQTKEKTHHLQFLTSDGFKVLVGRNDKENDYISFKLAKKDDLWFHVDGMPGSHVLLIREERNRDFSRDAISQAASLAAYFSKARNSKKVSVVYALAKHIRKPKNAKPGLVTLGREKSIVVAPKLVK